MSVLQHSDTRCLHCSVSFSGSFITELRNSGFDAGDVAAEGVKARGLFELGAGLLEAQIENLLAHVAAISKKFGKRLFLNFFALILFHNDYED